MLLTNKDNIVRCSCGSDKFIKETVVTLAWRVDHSVEEVKTHIIYRCAVCGKKRT